MAARTKIIAELASNWSGNVALLESMISEAAYAGADVAKVQLFDASVLHDDDPQKAFLTLSQITRPILDRALMAASHAKIELVASVFGIPQAKMAQAAGLEVIKVGSGEVQRLDLLAYCHEHFNVVWLSTGLTWFRAFGSVQRGEFNPVVFYGVSQYPTPYMRGLAALYQANREDIFSWSDHGNTLEVAKEAILYGATYVERHFTLPFRTGARRSAWDSEAAGIRELRDHAESCAWEGTDAHKDACEKYLTRWTGEKK